jgi:TM2 domain-containing membrane protein YozV
MNENENSKKAKGDLKNDLKEGAKKLKDKAKEIIQEIDENTKDFQDEAKNTASEFSKGAKDVYGQLASDKENKRVLAGVLGIIFGALGIHKFILGYQKEGIIMLVLSLLSFGFLAGFMALIGLIEGIIYLSKSDEEFFQIYQVGERPWF